MRAERPYRCVLCDRYFPWLHNKDEKTCRTCDVMTHFVMSAVRAGMGLPRDDPTFNIHDWEDGDGSEYDSDAERQFRKPWEFYGTGDSD